MEFSLDQISDIAHKVIADAAKRASSDHATVIAFSGDLGAGKTTMIKEMGKDLGVAEELVSPTFVIYKIYSIGDKAAPWKKMIHGDMYRLESSSEIIQLGWEQLITDPENLILIEWPEKIADVIPEWAAAVELKHAGESVRVLDIRS